MKAWSIQVKDFIISPTSLLISWNLLKNIIQGEEEVSGLVQMAKTKNSNFVNKKVCLSTRIQLWRKKNWFYFSNIKKYSIVSLKKIFVTQHTKEIYFSYSRCYFTNLYTLDAESL